MPELVDVEDDADDVLAPDVARDRRVVALVEAEAEAVGGVHERRLVGRRRLERRSGGSDEHARGWARRRARGRARRAAVKLPVEAGSKPAPARPMPHAVGAAVGDADVIDMLLQVEA